MNIGEQIVGDYLRYCRKCTFVNFNVYTTDKQGEIDVVAINPEERKVYFCEVAVHLTTGLQYTKDNRPNNTQKIFDKFVRISKYATDQFKDYEHVFMFWSPVVKIPKKAGSYNAVESVNNAVARLKDRNIDLEIKINDDFKGALSELRDIAAKESKELQSPIMRLFQIETHFL